MSSLHCTRWDKIKRRKSNGVCSVMAMYYQKDGSTKTFGTALCKTERGAAKKIAPPIEVWDWFSCGPFLNNYDIIRAQIEIAAILSFVQKTTIKWQKSTNRDY